MADSDANNVLVFTRYPAAGKCKTRLIPLLGEDGAARLAEAFLKDIAARLADARLGRDVKLILCYDPPDARDRLKELLAKPESILKRFSMLAQGKGDLGQRLAAATQRVRGSSRGAIVFLGTDAPDVPLDVIETGFEHAGSGTAFLKPAYDGGYVSIAIPGNVLHTAFYDIDWTAPDTGRQQAARLRALGAPTIVANSKWWDVDQPEDLAPLLERLEGNAGVAPRTLALLREFYAQGLF